jgi:hypothetical protein
MRQWTEAERLRQAELIKQWQPWQHSTGATTAHGKAKAKMNALKHGAYSEEMRMMMQRLREQREALQEMQDFLP